MNMKTKLTILRHLNERHTKASGIAKGFTLVELMIVVAVLGILAAVALPQYQQARNAAEAGAALGQAIGLAKECATAVAAGGIGMPTANCSTGAVSSFPATWSGTVANLRCLGTTFNGSAATINVTARGSLECFTGTGTGT